MTLVYPREGGSPDWTPAFAGVHLFAGRARFGVRSPNAEAVWLCLFDGDAETRVAMVRDGDDWVADEPDAGVGTRYGYRASGPPPFDVAKLLIDPYATTLDRAFGYDPRLGEYGVDTANLVPKAVVTAPLPPATDRRPLPPGGLVYELNVRGFTMLHPQVPEAQRGTIAALAHPAVIAHLRKLRVDAVELMPVTAWIDERHLHALGLRNAWGYNPVVPMALDPRLAPGGIGELRATVDALHAAGIGVILDLVFNHSGESDLGGPTLSFRGLDDAAYARDAAGVLVNDTGTGNTFDFGNPAVRAMTVAALRHFAEQGGVDGFRFDLAPVMARSPGFDRHAPIFAEIAGDPVLAGCTMIAEPWDIGPGGYQLGAFPDGWLEWNDRYRDDVRRFWRGDAGVAALAMRMTGSSDVFAGARSRSVNFVAAHDGFTLRDCVSHGVRHNRANGEDNRDGHGDEVCWNNGVEGTSDDPAVIARRAADVRAMLATLFASKGAIMLCAGDEFGRTQDGNNNAYAQDNATGWLDWVGRDAALEDFVAGLAAARAGCPAVGDPAFLAHAGWLRLDGAAMTVADWESGATAGFEVRFEGVAIRVDREARIVTVT